MFFVRFRPWLKTLRLRLMVWNVMVIVLTALAVLVGLRAAVRYAIQHEMDLILGEDVFEIEYALADAQATPEAVRAVVGQAGGTSPIRVALDEFNRRARGHANHGWFTHIWSPEGELLWSSDLAPDDVPPLADVPDFQPQDRPGQRIVQSRKTTLPYSPLYVQVGVSTEFLGREMQRIDRLVVLAVLAVLVTAPPASYWLASREMRPLSQMTHATSHLHPEKLDTRLPLRGTGDELDQLARTINGLLDRLADHLSHHQDFLANSAHELRTPLAAIHAAIEVVLGRRSTPEQADELLVGVLEQCTSLESLVNQLLLLAETENERLRVHGELCDVSGIVERACRMFQLVAESRDIKMTRHVEPGLVVQGNAYHLRQVVNNLIDNALKFTPAGGEVEIQLHAVPDNLLRFTVRDTGIGIGAADREHIFERFFRADRARTHNGPQSGTGLGLSICRAVVEAHGGAIDFAAEPKGGTTFNVRLPLAEPRDPAASGPEWPGGSPAK